MSSPPDPLQHFLAQGLAAHRAGRLAEAAAHYQAALAQSPNHLEALYLLGVARGQANAPHQALELFDRALAVNPNAAPVHNSRGVALKALGRLDDAIAAYDRALALAPRDVDAQFNRGIALAEASQLDEALAAYEAAIALRPDHAAAQLNRGFVLNALRRPAEALSAYDRVLALQPDHAQAHANRGLVLNELNRAEEALAAFDRAIALQPGHAPFHAHRGASLALLRRFADAIAQFDRAIALDPSYADAHANRGTAFAQLHRYEDAAAGYRHALALDPDYEFLPGMLLHARMMACDWRDLAADLAALEPAIRARRKAIRPLAMIGLLDDPALQRIVAEVYTQAHYPPAAQRQNQHVSTPSDSIPPRPAAQRQNQHATPRDKIRLGYFSADFGHHPTSFLSAGLFEAHDRARFELYAFSFALGPPDRMRQRIAAAFDRFIEVRGLSDAELVAQARQLGLDVAIDLMGHTNNARTGVFAARCAPIQVSYLGFPGTTGASFIDYLIADATVAPRESHAHFSEQVVWLPHSYQANDDRRPIADAPPTRAQAGLPERGFVFCCFNNSYKILPATFDRWMRLLQAVPGSVLWLLDANPAAKRNLRREAERRGVAGDRLVFAPRAPVEQHLARHRLADLFLDTLPCNAHTTASDALWAGLPVLTCPGRAFAARVAASLLTALDVPELIAPTPEAYEARALELARDPARLAALREKVGRNRHTAPLFDTKRFTRDIEAAYIAMVERSRAGLGLSIEGIDIPIH